MPHPEDHRKNLDIKCLKCGAFNLLENHICGRCGANLPVIFDESGKVFNWREAPHYKALLNPGAARRMSPFQRALFLRLVAILFLILVIIWMYHRR